MLKKMMLLAMAAGALIAFAAPTVAQAEITGVEKATRSLSQVPICAKQPLLVRAFANIS
jgi:hypothetical protein